MPDSLTALAQCAGCAAKLSPSVLQGLLSGLQTVQSPNLLVGFDTNDDAAVYRLSRTQAIVSTVDFFPPVVDDAFDYGAIAAANALSDIWAMGATPLFALNIAAFPKDLPRRTIKKILQGGATKAAEAGIPIVGGHTIQSAEPKYGLAVTGIVHPKRILTNAGGKAGDVLLLTKPIGTGIATTAMKRKLASKALSAQATKQMATLNQAAGTALASTQFKVNALTDVTGFGLLGHLLEMARGAGVSAVLELERVPLLPEVAALASQGIVPGGTRNNLAHVARWTRFPKGLPEDIRYVLADAQTNGGLLAAVPASKHTLALQLLKRHGVDAWSIGRLVSGPPRVHVV